MVLGYFFAGWLNQVYGWRATFMILGLPGIILAILARLTLRGPRFSKSAVDIGAPGAMRSGVSGAGTLPLPQPTVGEVGLTLWGNATFLHLALCFAITSLFSVGLLQWQASFFIRSHGLQTRHACA
jgi:MFS transporter, Spinster family, sphingosine-1-phosphate transporter